MSGKRVLFVAEAVTLAHVGRMMSLAEGLDPNRYKPVLAWADRFNDILGPLPGPWFPLSSISTALFLERVYRNEQMYDFETLDRYVKDDLAMFQATSPSAVVGDFRLSLAVSTAVAGIPYFNVVNAHWSPYAQTRWIVPQSSTVDRIGPFLGQVVLDLFRPFFVRIYAKGFNSLAKKWGRPSLGSDARKINCAGDRTLYPDLPDLVPTKHLPASHRFLGPVVWSPKIFLPDILSRPAPGKKTVYVALGTSGYEDALPAILEGLASRPLRVLVAAGPNKGVENPAPDRLEMHVSPFFSGQEACRAADLVIHNGGSGSVNQCLLAGVPFIGAASNLDQFSTMYFAEGAGLGKTIRADRIVASALVRLAGELLDDASFRQRAAAVQSRAQAFKPSDILMEELDKMGLGRS